MRVTKRTRAARRIVTVIVQVFGDDREAKNRTYRGVIRTIQEVYGADALCRPVREHDLSMTLKGKDLAGETMVWSFGKSILYGLWYSLRIR